MYVYTHFTDLKTIFRFNALNNRYLHFAKSIMY